MSTQKTLKIIMALSLMPLLYALFLAIYFWFNLADLTDVTFKFARLNSYIYAHSYGAILLVAFCGISIGLFAEKNQSGLLALLSFLLILITWLSYKSFGDWQGMVLLIFCWVLNLCIFRYFNRTELTNNKLYRSVLKLHTAVIAILALIVLING
jgi:hypothetical protein